MGEMIEFPAHGTIGDGCAPVPTSRSGPGLLVDNESATETPCGRMVDLLHSASA